MKRPGFAVILFAMLAACRSARPLPPLPDVSTAAFLPAIRAEVDSAMAAAKARPGDAAAVGRLGMTLHAHKQLNAAKACYRRASLLEPANFDWLYYLGVVSEGTEAADAFRAALRIRDSVPARLKLGEALLSLGDQAAARDVYRGLDHPAALFGYGRAANDPSYYEKALAAFPQYGAAMFALAESYQRAGRTADAQKLMTSYPKYKTVAPPVDDPIMESVRALNRGTERLLEDAIQLEAQGHLEQAVDLQLQAIALNPQLAQPHINLISLYGRLANSGEARKHLDAAVAIDPHAAQAYYNFGVLCYQDRRREEARSAFERAVAIDPNHAEAHNNLGTLLEEQGKLDAAAKQFEKAIELRPDLSLARFHLGRIYANRQKWAPAIEQFRRAVEVEDDATPTYLYALGATQARAGDTAAAEISLIAARDKASARGQASLAESIGRDLGRLRAR